MRRLPSLIACGLVGLGPSALADGESDKKAVRTWRSTCAACHGATGRGDTEQGQKMGLPDMSLSQWQQAITDERIKETITKGVKREAAGVVKEMPAFAEALKPEIVEALVKVVRGHAATAPR